MVLLMNSRTRTSGRYLRSGFSLMELMVYITIVGLIVAALTFGILQIQERSYKNATDTTFNELKFGIDNFYNDTQQYPTTLKDLITRPQGEGFEGWAGPYLTRKAVPKNGWGKPFTYQATENGDHPYELKTKNSSGETLSVWKK
jgi:general secretion pathway protein G